MQLEIGCFIGLIAYVIMLRGILRINAINDFRNSGEQDD
jgi:hypothetical protein